MPSEKTAKTSFQFYILNFKTLVKDDGCRLTYDRCIAQPDFNKCEQKSIGTPPIELVTLPTPESVISIFKIKLKKKYNVKYDTQILHFHLDHFSHDTLPNKAGALPLSKKFTNFKSMCIENYSSTLIRSPNGHTVHHNSSVLTACGNKHPPPPSQHFYTTENGALRTYASAPCPPQDLPACQPHVFTPLRSLRPAPRSSASISLSNNGSFANGNLPFLRRCWTATWTCSKTHAVVLRTLIPSPVQYPTPQTSL